jgi:NhaP-type Na+/H+ and K+/H+ antiporter
MISRLVKGAQYSEKYGSHPGTPILIFFVAVGALAGLDKGIYGACIGAAVMLAWFGSLWLIGCWERGE